jgi:uncharacterized membrane protein YhhN
VAVAWLFTGFCLLCVAGLLLADRFDNHPGRAVMKAGASSAFVAVAWQFFPLTLVYGQWLLAALLLGWLGDLLLLSRKPAMFMGGLGAFLLSHLCFGGAFLSGAVSLPAMGLALLPALAVGALVLRWLWPHLPADFKLPVLLYVLAILGMCVAAAGHAGATGRWLVLAGAVLFAASDISVARDRFVAPGRGNRLWGWPTYFVAQLMLAWSLAGLR